MQLVAVSKRLTKVHDRAILISKSMIYFVAGWKVVAAAKGVSDHGEKLITGEVKSKGFPTRCMRFYWPYLKPGQ
jgi:hypothetical protein